MTPQWAWRTSAPPKRIVVAAMGSEMLARLGSAAAT
jgi:hypothetical protein